MKRNLPLIAALFFWILLLTPLHTQAETLVEAVVAVLSFEKGEPLQKVIYLSDLERHRLFFEGSENTIVDTQDSTTTNKTRIFVRRRDAVIDQEIFLREALRFAIKKPEGEEVLAALKNIRQRFQTETHFESALQKSALSLSALKAKITLYLWVDQLLQERIKEFIFIVPKAVDTYYLDHLEIFIGQEIESIETKITKILRRKKEVEKKEIYLKRLKEKVRIEFMLSDAEIPERIF